MTEALVALEWCIDRLEHLALARAENASDRNDAKSFAVRARISMQTLRASLSAEPVDARVGKWLSAALEDPTTCAEMRADIEAWFASRAPELTGKKET